MKDMNQEKEKNMMAFVVTCIETTARELGMSYEEIYYRMKQTKMIENYILPYYNILHSESRETLVQLLIQYMRDWEKKNIHTPFSFMQELIMKERIASIVMNLSDQLNIDSVKILKLFYESETCRKLHDKSTELYLHKNPYIIDEFIREMENLQ